MKVLIVAPYAYNRFHFETDLELAQSHIDAGDDVMVLRCPSLLAACDINIDHQPEICLSCISRCNRGLKELSAHVPTIPFVRLDPADTTLLRGVRSSFSSLDDLKDFTFQSLDVGYAVFSSLVSQIRDPYPSLEEQSDRVRRLVTTSISVYLSINRLLTDEPFDRVYVFNGRYAPLRGVLRACQDHGVTCFLHERGSTIEKYALFENALPHEIEKTEGWIEEAWESAPDDEQRRRIAENFYSELASGISKNWFSFVDRQEPGRLPRSWDPDNRNVVIYTTSEEEMVSISDEWKNPIYVDQIDGLERIAADARKIPGLHLFIRIHPNVRGQQSEDIRRTIALHGPGIEVIPAESEVDTYVLLRSADRVLTFGSTVGIEAAFWGKPSILAGSCFYRNLGSTYNPMSHDEVMELLIRDLEPLDKLGALKFGHYWATFGLPFRHYQPTGVFQGRFRGTTITASAIARLTERVLESPIGRPLRAAVRSISLGRLERRITKTG